eukprot:2022384-Rhodomonas_salina.2
MDTDLGHGGTRLVQDGAGLVNSRGDAAAAAQSSAEAAIQGSDAWLEGGDQVGVAEQVFA